MDSNRSFTVHAHFYQPPRETPATKDVPSEPSAYPYHDWNEKIFETCYLPNIEIGNFSHISFDIGPTLNRWLRSKHPEALQRIVDADRKVMKETGHGNAIAQSYHHTILPLSSKEEKETEITWGIQDFIHTYGRRPEGMWLPETAVDNYTLCYLYDQGVKFTILAPWQVKPSGEDGCSPYMVKLPGNRKIAVFTYSGELSARASFDNHATSNADHFAREYLETQFRGHDLNQCVMMATDGELYGHHQTFREMFLSQMVNGSLKSIGVQLEYPAAYLEKKVDLPEVTIIENTSWSCHHGVKRWHEECDCTPGAKWKALLRESLNDIARDIDFVCKKHMEEYGIDVITARNSYIRVMLGDISFNTWITDQTTTKLSLKDIKMLAFLFQAQEYRLRMFASCGWFFNEFDRIEPRNNILNAAYAIYLVDKAIGINLVQKYQTLLSNVKSEETGISGDIVFNEGYAIYTKEKTN